MLFCENCSNCFGCVGIKNKNYCILNKQYSKEEYEEILPRLIKHMNEKPFVTMNGIIYKYGEFLPMEFSPFAYNDSIAQEFFPITKELASKLGYKWIKKEERDYKIDLNIKDLPDNNNTLDDSIVGKVISCAHGGGCTENCTQGFKIITQEFLFYKKMNLPLPTMCPNCRHYQRLKKRNPLKLWHRQCMCDKKNHSHGEDECKVKFETSYSPDRPEIVYCEKCYQAEVY